jgi:creatinine amidohydrolase
MAAEMNVTGVRLWADVTSAEISGLDPEATVVILPVAAVEQHGPHLPLGTDMRIADALIGVLRSVLPAEEPVLILPTQAVGVSTEHLAFPGTLTLSPETAIRAWTEIGASVARAGLRKLVLFNAHGGNSAIVDLVARELRAHHAMLAVTVHWARFGYPEGLWSAEEQRFGIHAGAIETSLMLHHHPESIRRQSLGDFPSLGGQLASEAAWLSTDRPAGFGWMAQDLHPSGAVGNASRASAEDGARLTRHVTERFAALIDEVRRFPLDLLRDRTSS